MKTKLIALALCSAAATTGLYAQQTTKPMAASATTVQSAEMRAEESTEQMTKELGLTAEQTTKVEAINARFAKSMTELRSAGLDDTALKARGSALRDGRDHDLKSVLTTEQYEKMLSLRKAKKDEGLQRKQTSLQQSKQPTQHAE